MNPKPSTRHIQNGVIADDLTGACDTGAVFAQMGLATTVVLDRKANPPPDAEIIVLTTSSRNEPARQAVRQVAAACRYLRTHRIRVLYKKIDSTLKGNLAVETATVSRLGGFARAILCPAYPAQGRAVRQGVLFVRGKRAAPVASIFAALKDARFVSVHSPITASKLAAAIRSRTQFILPDARTDADLDCLVNTARRSNERILLAGSGGLTTALASAMMAKANSVRRQMPNRTTDAANESAPPPLVLVGSNNPVTGRQIDALLRAKHARLHTLGDLSRAERQELMSTRGLAVIRVPVHQVPDEEILTAMSELDLLFSEARLTGLVVIGGDTAALILRWLGTQAIEVRGEIAPGLPWGRMIGGKADGLVLCTKAGGFGKRNGLVQIVAFLTRNLR